MRGKKFSIGLRALAIFAVTLLATSTWAATREWNEKVLHNFNCTDGCYPDAGLISDAAGNLYGTTDAGGTYGFGAVFELTPNGSGGWTEKVLYSFCSQTNCTDGENTIAGLIFDTSGNLYGTTYNGGTYGDGTVFELTPAGGGNWTENVLYSFGTNGQHDGGVPYAGLIFDAAGNLYGTTDFGGNLGRGTVFELTRTAGGGWTETLLYSFCISYYNCTDGANPLAGLIIDAAGNLYGTTSLGGIGSCTGNNSGCGTVFELTPNGIETVLHTFDPNGTDGTDPWADLIFDAAGNLYGTTIAGGIYNAGSAFELTPAGGGNWTETVLYSVGPNGADEGGPHAGLIFDAAGNLYGTTDASGFYNQGTVFELTPIYPCVVCSHSVLGEVDVRPTERRDVLEPRKPIE